MKLAAGRADEGGGGWDGRRQMATRPRTGTELGAGHHVDEEVFSSLSVQWMVACSLAKWVSAIRGGGLQVFRSLGQAGRNYGCCGGGVGREEGFRFMKMCLSKIIGSKR